LGGLNIHSFFNPGDQVGREAFLKLIAGIGYQTGMNITPKEFQIRIHAGKRTGHDRISGANANRNRSIITGLDSYRHS
jgi:hypothetical protein